MFYKIVLNLAILTTLCTQSIVANNLNGSWHLRIMDGTDVRKARAILNFNIEKMKLSGFDACNRIGGRLVKNNKHNMAVPILMSTKMACRGKIFNWVSKRLYVTIKEGFSIKEEKKYGIKGITIKSFNHELFFKKMGK